MSQELKTCLEELEETERLCVSERSFLSKDLKRLAEAKSQLRELKSLDGDADHVQTLKDLQGEISDLILSVRDNQTALAVYDAQLLMLEGRVRRLQTPTASSSSSSSSSVPGATTPTGKPSKLVHVSSLPKFIPEVTELHEFFETTSALLIASKIPPVDWVNYLVSQSVDYPAVVTWINSEIISPLLLGLRLKNSSMPVLTKDKMPANCFARSTMSVSKPPVSPTQRSGTI